MHARALVVVVALLASVVACGDSPTAPPDTRLTGLSIAPATDLIRIKASESFTLNGTLSDGSSRAVQGTWGTDAPGVATIDSTGRATGVASGQATTFGDYQGQRATRLLRVVPDYHGRWRGDWNATGCGDDGDWRGACGEFPVGSLWGLNVVATQNRDAVIGTTDFGDDLRGPVTGTIRVSGHLVLSGTYTIAVEGIPIEVTVSDWETITTDNERMAGRFSVTFRAPGLQGALRVDAELRIVGKTSATPALAAGGEAMGLGRAIARLVRRR